VVFIDNKKCLRPLTALAVTFKGAKRRMVFWFDFDVFLAFLRICLLARGAVALGTPPLVFRRFFPILCFTWNMGGYAAGRFFGGFWFFPGDMWLTCG